MLNMLSMSCNYQTIS